MRVLPLCLIIIASCLPIQKSLADDPPFKMLVDPNNSFGAYVVAGNALVLRTYEVGWGPQWSFWVGFGSKIKSTSDELNLSQPLKIGTQNATVGLHVKARARQVIFDYEITANQDIAVLQIVAALTALNGKHADILVTNVAGTQKKLTLPANPSSWGIATKLTVTSASWIGPIDLDLDPPMDISADGELRPAIVKNLIKAGTIKQKITWTFPADVTLLDKEADILTYAPVVAGDGWFPFQGKWTGSSGPLSAEDFLDKPAGKHGGVRIKDGRFALEDGTPIQFWGTNLAYGQCAPSHPDADSAAARFAKYGINAVRMHKFANSGWQGIGDDNTATKMKPDGLDRLDYFSKQLSDHGVYYGWSPSFHLLIRPGDKDRVAGYDELMKKGGDTYAVINWAPDLQDILIARAINLLKHKNPFTGLTYADDPALCYLELQNEDDIFFWASDGADHDFPTYHALLLKQFAQWLQDKYGSQEALAKAWNGELKPDETLAAANIKCQMSPWFASDDHLPKARANERQRILDNTAFLYDTQNKFYQRFVKAIRDTGYKGPLVGSPWQAPGMLPHYDNLKADAMVGYIDRHNYFGGGLNDTMLGAAGSGYLSTGLQQVAGRPFGVSEWITVYPSLYSVEGPVLMAAYGLGLQGWGASYEFVSQVPPPSAASEVAGNLPWGIWNADVPTQIGIFPILARMIYRGDVSTGPVISVRRVSAENLQRGEFDFSDKVRQTGDVKTFSGSVTAESLAAGRDLVEFVDHDTPSTFPDMAKYQSGSVITSATGQLKWDTAGGGLVTIDTPGTQGYVGFAAGKTLTFSGLQISCSTPYAAILITASEPKATLTDGKKALICAVARNANKGFRMFTLDNHTIVDNGAAPIMLEPVHTDITFTSRKVARVNILDQDGRSTGQTLPLDNGIIHMDTGRDHTIYYEVEFQ